MKLKSVGILSCAKIAGCIYGLIGLLVGGLFSLFSIVGLAIGTAQGNANEAVFALFFGLGAVLVLPVFYGVLGFVFAAIGAALYNLIAKIVGGIELELE